MLTNLGVAMEPEEPQNPETPNTAPEPSQPEQTPPPNQPDQAPQPTKGYGKRPLWQWILIYVVVAIIVYGLIYILFIHKSGSRY